MVGWIRIDDHKEFDLVTVQLIDQFAQSYRLVDRVGSNRVAILHTSTNGPQSKVDRVSKGVELGWLGFANQNQTSVASSTQIGSGGLNKSASRGGKVYFTAQARDAQSLSKGKTDTGDQTSLHR